MPTDLRTRAIVLRRTNYGETDRILSLLTPEGKVAVLAKGVRKEKSRLAGGIELFSVSDVVIHQRPSAAGTPTLSATPTRSPLGILTSAKMLQFHSRLLSDLPRLELASDFLKKVDRATNQVSSPEHFALLTQSLAGLDQSLPIDLCQTWFLLNLARISGEEVNLLCDVSGQPLSVNQTYTWDAQEQALRPVGPAAHLGSSAIDAPSGPISAREIKLARFLLSSPLAWATKIDGFANLLPALTPIARSLTPPS